MHSRLRVLLVMLATIAQSVGWSGPADAATITWTAQSSLGEIYFTNDDYLPDAPIQFQQTWTRFIYLSDRSVSWPSTVTVETQLDPFAISTYPTTLPNFSGSTATYRWSTKTGVGVQLYRKKGPLYSPGYAVIRELSGGRIVPAGATETRRFTARFMTTRSLTNYSMYLYFEPNWGTPTPPTLPVAPSNVRCLPSPNNTDPLRPAFWGWSIPAGTEIAAMCEVTLTNRTTTPVEYIPEVYVTEQPRGGASAMTSPTTASNDDPTIGRTTYSVTPPAGTDFRGYATTFWFRSVSLDSENRVITGSPPASCPAARPDMPTQSVYLPNITKTLGGPTGWVTPFIVQNTGAVATSLEVSFYRFRDGACVARRSISSVAPGTSFSDHPNADTDLPDNTQFSVVVRSFGAPVVATVNQVQGTGDSSEGLAYMGISEGATRVSLPNVTRRFYGWDVPFIIQNLSPSGAFTVATATFTAFDGSHTYMKSVTIAAGRSAVIDPDYEPAYAGYPGSGLRDGTQYAVTITSAQPVAVVANAHNEQGAPVAYSHNGLAAGASTVWAPYAAKGGPNGVFSPIVVQNTGALPTDATLDFTPLGGGASQRFVLPAIPAGASRAFDVRFTDGSPPAGACAVASASCLGPGEYSLKISSAGSIAAVVLPVTSTTAAAYTAALTSGTRSYLPNVTRTLGGPSGWTTALYVQSATATGATLRWYRFRDGALMTTQTLSLTPGTSLRIDPRGVAGLADDMQYAVVIDGVGGTLVAIVHEQAAGGDNDMIYEGFAP